MLMMVASINLHVYFVSNALYHVLHAIFSLIKRVFIENVSLVAIMLLFHFSLFSTSFVLVYRCIDASSSPSIIEKIFLVVGMLCFFAMGTYTE